MSRVKRNYYLPGARYSLNKDSIKAVFKKHKLVWKGTMEFPRWMSTTDTIVAEFLRENEVTVGANLKFDGDPLGPFCLEFTKLMEGLGAEYDDAEVVSQEEVDAEIEKAIEEKIAHWEKVHRPQTELMRKGTIHNGYKPVPEGFINAALKDFKEKREIEIERIRGELKSPNKKILEEPDETAKTDDVEMVKIPQSTKRKKSQYVAESLFGND